jgi:topoisomerase IV subunit B
MARKNAAVYDESKVKTLSSLEHIRLRTGMYIGRIGDGSNPDDGIYVLIKEVVDNSVDEYISGYGKKIDVELKDHTVTVRDYGRGIPLGKVIECVSVINTGAKYNDDVFQFSVGLNGVGTKAVNALSSAFKVAAYREGEVMEANFCRGKLLDKKRSKAPASQRNGTLIQFTPDPEIFAEHAFNTEYIERRLWIYVCLNTGLRITLNGKNFESKNGLLDLLQTEVGESTSYPMVHYKAQYLEFAFTHTATYGENYFSFVNGQYTSDGGTHLSAFREGLLKGVNEYYKADYNGVDIREGIAGAVALKLKNPVFESQTKNKLGNAEIRGWIINDVRSAVVDFLHKHADVARSLQTRIEQNEKLRTELNTVKKQAKEAAKRIEIKIPKLKDCKYHCGDGSTFAERTTIFLTEGQSAGGSIVSARDPLTQAIYTLKGKPENVYGRNKTAIYKNEELYGMMMALGIEEDVQNLRYNRIVLATDADVDGFHIRNLLLTFFLNFFEELVVAGHVHILETPLFRVRDKKQTIYCYSERERDKAYKTLAGAPETTRFKGLGEISPKEFGQFIGDGIRLVKVDVKPMKQVPQVLEFYMGKNTPERRDFIMENLI